MLNVKQNLISSETNYLRVTSRILEWLSSWKYSEDLKSGWRQSQGQVSQQERKPME